MHANFISRWQPYETFSVITHFIFHFLYLFYTKILKYLAKFYTARVTNHFSKKKKGKKISDNLNRYYLTLSTFSIT